MRRLGAALLALLVALPACRGGGGGGGGSSDGTVVLGALVALSGPAAEAQAGAADVLRAWEAEAAKAGGAAGRPVRVRVEDTASDAAGAAAAAERLRRDGAVLAVISLDPTTEGSSVPALADAGVPVVGGLADDAATWSRRAAFPTSATRPASAQLEVLAAKAAGATAYAAVACEGGPGCATATAAYGPTATVIGLRDAGTATIPAAEQAPATCPVAAARPDHVRLPGVPGAARRAAAACRSAGYGGVLGLSGWALARTVVLGEPRIDGAGSLPSFPWWVEDEPVQAYRAAMAAHGVEEEAWSSAAGTAAWAAARLFAKALGDDRERLGDRRLDRDDVLTTYGSVHDETLGGLLPQALTFVADGPNRPIYCSWQAKWAAGTFVAVPGGLRPSCIPSRVLPAAGL